jgi:hypothetical protein
MCWNPDISINTFLFAIFSLLFIFLTNKYSKYKLKEFKNPIVYLLLLEIALIQLIEFFLWRNLKNKYINNLLSQISSFIITIQPITVILMITDLNIRYLFIVFYSLFIIFYLLYKHLYSPIYFNTYVEGGHLSWQWTKFKGYETIFYFIYLFFYVGALLLINNIIALFIIVSLFVSLFFYFKNNTFSSMWCWYSNFILLYFIIVILIIKPFYEYNKLC